MTPITHSDKMRITGCLDIIFLNMLIAYRYIEKVTKLDFK